MSKESVRADELEAVMRRVAFEMRTRALLGVCDGREHSQAYIELCRHIHAPTRTVLIFTRDVAMHSSGWFKNPDYERCLHLSLSPIPSVLFRPRYQRVIVEETLKELDKKTESLWVRAFFGEHIRYAWRETPKTAKGKRVGVMHWRVFCDEHWQPILPRGEVYGKELTEKGWKSASELGVDIVTAPGMDPG